MHRRKRAPKDILFIMLCKACKSAGLPEPETEYKFHPTRKWLFDYAWPHLAIDNGTDGPHWIKPVAIEIQGGTFRRGKHSRGAGQANDMEKLNEAQRLGWRVLQFDASMIKSQPKRQKCVNLVMEMLQ